MPQLNIIGGGAEYDSINSWITDHHLEHKIKLLGAIYDKEVKRDYFQRAFACISPLQAGLSVLESMGYGVPFVTMHNAFTGGERFNIEHNVNGILLKNENELSDVLVSIAQSPERFREMGENAYKHYHSNRTPELMAQGVIDAIEFMLK